MALTRSAQQVRSPLMRALAKSRTGLIGIVVLSAGINVLVLGGSLYMMLVYDRVLPSHSIVTLMGLLVLLLTVYAFQAGFEMMRSNMLGDVAAELARSLRPRVAETAHHMAMSRPAEAGANNPMRDLDQVQSFIAGPGPAALIDLPWIIFFLFILSMLHVWLGVTALIGTLFLVGLTWTTDRANRQAVQGLSEMGLRRHRIVERQRLHAELIHVLGMRGRTIAQVEDMSEQLSLTQRRLNEKNTVFSVSSRSSRMVLQSLILTVGALLVLSGEATAGVIFASSILSGRALAPVDQVIAQWRNFVGARGSWARLNELVVDIAEVPARLKLPAPRGELRVENLSVRPPASTRQTVTDVSFNLKAGAVVGIIGPSAAGKSSLVRAVIGAWAVDAGTVRLDGAAIDQWDSDDLGRHIGYLPQSVELFQGSIARNIARLDPEATSDTVIAAAIAAGVHELVLALPGGYEFDVGEDGMNLSAGQRQRIGLARALYGDPFLIALDEPNSNLDSAGELALLESIRGAQQRGAIVLIVAHRRQVLASVTDILVMDDGKLREFGPRDTVLARLASPKGAPNFSVVHSNG